MCEIEELKKEARMIRGKLAAKSACMSQLLAHLARNGSPGMARIWRDHYDRAGEDLCEDDFRTVQLS